MRRHPQKAEKIINIVEKMKVIDILERVCVNIISALYQYFPVSIVMAIFFMFVYKKILEIGIKACILEWLSDFKNFTEFRRIFALVVYICLILFRTIFCRQIWGNPIGDVLGNWSLQFSDGTLSTELIENIILFIPFSYLTLRVFRDNLLHEKMRLKSICWNTTKLSFVFSFGIELCQILLRVGTFQISDLVTNTFGGTIGGVIYWIYSKKHKVSDTD